MIIIATVPNVRASGKFLFEFFSSALIDVAIIQPSYEKTAETTADNIPDDSDVNALG